MNPDTTIYIPVPVSETPKVDGIYMTKWKGVPAFTEKEFKEGKWQTRFDHTGLMIEWLKPVKLSDITTSQPVKSNEDKLVKALEEVQHHIDTWPDEPSRAIRLINKALESYRTSVKGEEQVDWDAVLTWADKDGWVYNNGQWHQDGHKSRFSKEILELYKTRNQ